MTCRIAPLALCASVGLACFERGPLDGMDASRDAASQAVDAATEDDAPRARDDVDATPDTPDTAPDSGGEPDGTPEDTGALVEDVGAPATDTAQSDADAPLADSSPTDASASPDTGGGLRACLSDGDCSGLVAADRCAGPVRCIDYGCRPDPALAVVCESSNPCLSSSCDPDTGACVVTSSCSCEPTLTVACGSETSWSTNDPGLHPHLGALACADGADVGPVRLVGLQARGRVRIEVNASVSEVHVLASPEDPSESDCEVDDCLWSQPTPAQADVFYFDVGAPQALTLALAEVGPNRLASVAATCDVTRERWCGDRLDDDGDGAVDCFDPDCVDDALCFERCIDPGLVTWCWENESEALPAGAGRASFYGCLATPQSGRERVFRFRPYYSETVRFGFSASPGLSLSLLEDRGDGCRPRDCLASAEGDLWYDVVANTTYYLVVDASHEFGGSFTLDFDCNPLAPEDP
jgi:hypothetical protein